MKREGNEQRTSTMACQDEKYVYELCEIALRNESRDDRR